MTDCRIARAEIEYDLSHEKLQKFSESASIEQMAAVQETAKQLMLGGTITDTRKRYNGAQVVGEYQVTYSKQNIAAMFAEVVTEEIITELYLGTVKGIFDAQKLIGDCACEIAFDALNLWDSPFADYGDLKSEWEQAQ